MTDRRVRRRVVRTAGGFAGFGIYWTTLTIAAPAIKSGFGLDDFGLGWRLSVALAVGAAALLPAAPLAEKYGAARLTRAGLVFLAAVAVLNGVVPGVTAFTFSLAVAGIGAGALEVGVNAAGIEAEIEARRPVLGWLHACFNGGALVWGILLVALIARGGGRTALFCASGACIAVMAIVAPPGRRIPARPPGTPRSGVLALVRERPRILALAAICALAFFAESVVGQWCFLYLREDLHASPFLAGAAFYAFEVTMVLGRSVLPKVQQYQPNRRILAALGAGLVLATAVTLATLRAGVTIAGFFLCGLMISALVPAVMGVAGEIAPDQLGNASAAITLVGYAGLALGPFLIGALADTFSLRGALGVLVFAGLGTVIASRWVPTATPAREPAA